MFGIALMGILTNLVQVCAGLVEDMVAAVTSTLGFCTAIPLGFAEGCEFAMSLCWEACVTFLRAISCGFCF